MVQSVDIEANHILRGQLGDRFDGVSEMLKSGELIGFTHAYLFATANRDLCSSHAKPDLIMELARIDLKKGLQPEVIVSVCCALSPFKTVIQEIIAISFSLIQNYKTSRQLMENIFAHEDADRVNCLMNCYYMLGDDNHKGIDPNTTSMKKEIEDTIVLLIEMGIDNGVDMARVINHVSKYGTTLFRLSSLFSEKVTLILMKMDVKVNEITLSFETVSFKVF